MPTITSITEQKRAANRRNIFLDGKFAFGCGVNVVAKFRLRVGMTLSCDQVVEIEAGEVKQECFDAAMQFIQRRLHSRSELRRKLSRRQWGDHTIEFVLDDLSRLGYVDDTRFAKTKALAAAEHKHHGRRRAFLDLIRCGVEADVAEKAIDEAYAQTDTEALAGELARKHAPRLSRLEPTVARRRLAGLLHRRGFQLDDVKSVLDEVLGKFHR